MTDITARLHEIEARKAELKTEAQNAETTTERLAEIKTEGEALLNEETELRAKADISAKLEPKKEEKKMEKSEIELRANAFKESGHTSMPMFAERRSVLVSSGQLATPTAVDSMVGELPEVVSSIVDDVEVIDATGTGSWKFAYRATDPAAALVTEGSNIGGTPGTFNNVEISGAEWGILDEVSNQVAKMSPVNYLASVQSASYLALRRAARDKIVSTVSASALAETRNSVAIDGTYVRNVVLNYDADESVAGNAKLYLCKADLAAIGAVRGTNEKKAVFDIEFTDPNNGQIKDGGTVIPFSICSALAAGTQLYGNPMTVKLLLWGDYEIATDEGGDYFKRNMIGIRALVTAGAGLVTNHGMQLIKQAAS